MQVQLTRARVASIRSRVTGLSSRWLGVGRATKPQSQQSGASGHQKC
nr:hypothetical protein [Acetobacter persici]